MKQLTRTAGQRRFLALQKKIDRAISNLQSLQSEMQRVNVDGKQLTQMHIMQKITEQIERLK